MDTLDENIQRTARGRLRSTHLTGSNCHHPQACTGLLTVIDEEEESMDKTDHPPNAGTESAAGLVAWPQTRPIPRETTVNSIDEQARDLYIISNLLPDGQFGGRMVNQHVMRCCQRWWLPRHRWLTRDPGCNQLWMSGWGSCSRFPMTTLVSYRWDEAMKR